MHRTNIYLEERQTSALDVLAKAQGLSRAEVIRQLIDRALGESAGDTAADLERIDASFGIEADVEVPSRSRTDRDRYLDELWRA